MAGFAKPRENSENVTLMGSRVVCRGWPGGAH